MRFDYPSIFAPMAATLMAVAVALAIGAILGFIALKRAYPEDRGMRLGIVIAINMLIIVIGAPLLNGALQDAQNGKLEDEQRAWVRDEYGLELTDAQYTTLTFPMMEPGEGTVAYGSATVELSNGPTTVELVAVDGLFSLRTADGMPLEPVGGHVSASVMCRCTNIAFPDTFAQQHVPAYIRA